MVQMLLLGFFLTANAAVAQPAAAHPGPIEQLGSCSMDDGIRAICLDGPEDIVPVPGTHLAITSGLHGSGGIKLIDVRTKTATFLYPSSEEQNQLDRREYPGCPGPAEITGKFITHGLALRSIGSGIFRVFAVHHGDRESIEAFTLDVQGAVPRLVWVGCAIAPQRMWLNAVVALPHGGLMTTDFRSLGPTTGDVLKRIAPEENTGRVWAWRPKSGWRKVPKTEAPGPNGIELSRDGKWIYVNAWVNRSFMRIRTSGTGRRQIVPLGFRPDNIRWGTDGKLYIAGQTDDAGHIVRIDPRSFAVTPLVDWPDTPQFHIATVAVAIDNELWVGSANRIRIIPLLK